jgi:hypothetical protein
MAVPSEGSEKGRRNVGGLYLKGYRAAVSFNVD